jgi:hypothetical protein
MKRALIYTFVIFFLALTARSCRHMMRVHYLDNDAVRTDSLLYSPDSNYLVIYYTLDVGARGAREYKSLIHKNEFESDLLDNNLPEQLVVKRWFNDTIIEVIYDTNELFRLGGMTDLDLSRDTLKRNNITIVVKDRIIKRTRFPF